MTITKQQIRSIRPLLSKEDKEHIANHCKASLRTVESILQGTRSNEDIARMAVQLASDNLEGYAKLLQEIREQGDKSHLTVEGYVKTSNSVGWAQGKNYLRHMDAYLQLSHIKFKEIEDLMATLRKDFPDLLEMDYYCVEVIRRVMGLTQSAALKNFLAYFRSI